MCVRVYLDGKYSVCEGSKAVPEVAVLLTVKVLSNVIVAVDSYPANIH